MKLSIIILSLNNEDTLEGCLISANFADEIIVVDSGSKDETLKIARKYTDKIYYRKLDSFAKQRNYALRKAKGEWVFYLDSDEQISTTLVDEINLQLATPRPELGTKACNLQPYNAFRMPRENYFFGQKIKYGGYWPDYVTRIFKKINLAGWSGKIHESPKIDGQVGILKNPLLHCSHRDLSSSLTKSIHWTKLEAELFYEKGHPKVSWWRLFRVFLTEFFQRYLVKKGFLDGVVGFFESWIQGFNRILVYVYLWEMQSFPRHPERQRRIS